MAPPFLVEPQSRRNRLSAAGAACRTAAPVSPAAGAHMLGARQGWWCVVRAITGSEASARVALGLSLAWHSQLARGAHTTPLDSHHPKRKVSHPDRLAQQAT